MAEYFTFECGCKFPILDKTGEFPKVDFSPKLENLNLECSRTWDLISSGNTKGVFQLESRLGHMMAKKLKPENIEQLSDLISIIRPGALEAVRDGKSVTNHYIDKKNGIESLDYFHSALEPSLESTLGEMIYQEQAMQIAKDIAGFDLKEADDLRKCIAEDSLVMTKTGPKKIQDLCNQQVKPQILTLDKNNKLVFKKIKNVWFSGVKKVFEIVTINGFRIELTENHKVFTQRGWVEVKNLTDNDSVILPKKYLYGGNNRYSIDETILISYILSEGYHVKDSNTTIVNKNLWIINTIKNILIKRFGKGSFSIRKSNGCFIISLKNVAQRWADKNIAHAKSRFKTIPKGVIGSTNKRAAAFIGSFFSAEGCISKYSLEISSTSLSMIQNLQMMLLRDGVFASIQVHNDKYKNKPYTSYRLNISKASNIKLFGKIYGKYICPAKLKKINKFNTNKDHNHSFLVPKNFVRAATQSINVNELITSPGGGSLYNCGLTYDRARWLNNHIHSDLLQEALDADYRYVKIRKIMASVEKNTYDFEVDDDHSHFGFVNGICVHNCIGKKQVDKMATMKSKFLDGCKSKNIVNENEAEQIFGWIEKSQRYSFNRSHGVSYAINAYLSAYAKAHFPRIFFASYLKFAKDKIDPQQEIKELVRNANEMDILVKTPDFRNLNRFFLLKNKDIYFGLTDIKGVGESVYKKILEICKDLNLKELDWLSTLFTILININSTASKALISCGAFDYFKKNRTEMLFEYETCSSLTQKETEKLIAIKNLHKIKDLKALLIKGVEEQVATKKRMETLKNLLTSLENPPYSLTDKIEWLSDSENSLLGVSITCSKLDSYDIEMTNTDCKTLKNSAVNNNIIIAGEITNINVVKTKTGKNPGQEMAFVSIEDQTGFVDSIILFPEQWTQFKSHLFIGNVLIFVGNKAKNKDGLIVEKCFAPKT